MKLEKFDRKVNLAFEYIIHAMIFVMAAAVCCGAWWQLFWVAALIPLWVVIHRENYGKFRRTWLDWMAGFFVIFRCVERNGGVNRRLMLFNPLGYLVFLLIFVIAGVAEGVAEAFASFRKVIAERRKERNPSKCVVISGRRRKG